MAFVIIPARKYSPKEDRDNFHIPMEVYIQHISAFLRFLEERVDQHDFDLEVQADVFGITNLYQNSFCICNKQKEEKKGEMIMANFDFNQSDSVSEKTVQSMQELLDELQRIAARVKLHDKLIDAIDAIIEKFY